MIHAAQNTIGAVQTSAAQGGVVVGVQTDCEDALLILPERKRIRSEPSSALNQVNNEHNDGNHEQEMDQTAANVADKAQKPEHH